MPLNMKQCIEELRRKVRTLKETVEVYDLNYCYLRDLVVDAACYVKQGEPIPQSVLDELANFEWKEDGVHVPMADSDRFTAFAANSRHAPEPTRPRGTRP